MTAKQFDYIEGLLKKKDYENTSLIQAFNSGYDLSVAEASDLIEYLLSCEDSKKKEVKVEDKESKFKVGDIVKGYDDFDEEMICEVTKVSKRIYDDTIYFDYEVVVLEDDEESEFSEEELILVESKEEKIETKFKINIDTNVKETLVLTKKEAIEYVKEEIETEIEAEKEDMADMEIEENTERLNDLLELDKNDIYELEVNTELLYSHGNIEIIEFNYYLTEILDKFDIEYDDSTMSKSTYIYFKDKLIRISNHKVPRITNDYGHRNPDIDLIYSNEFVDNEDLKKYLDIDVEGIIKL